MTLGSLLWFAIVWLKYEVTPEPLRYFWWVVWSKVRVAAHGIHRRLVVQGECTALLSCCETPSRVAVSYDPLPENRVPALMLMPLSQRGWSKGMRHQALLP